MMSPATFRQIVSGARRDPLARLLRGALRLAETPYTWAMRLRNRRYDSGKAPSTRVGVPVISVGNITLGGTGKTPLVAWLARWFRQHDVRVSLISRGYGATDGGRNDEALELEQRLPDVPHLLNPDRVAAAQVAIEELETELILLDDGFQHRRLARDLNIVLLDATEPFGYGHVFPRGMLREPLTGLARAQVIILSRADAVTPERRAAIRAEVQTLAPQAIWAEAAHVPQALLNHSGQTLEFAALAGRPVGAFCGIGNPAGFRHTLDCCGLTQAVLREFPDHHAYSREDLDQLAHWAGEQHAAALLCTHKDLVKLGVDTLGPTPVWAVQIGVEFLAGQTKLEQCLAPLLLRRGDGGEGLGDGFAADDEQVAGGQ